MLLFFCRSHHWVRTLLSVVGGLGSDATWQLNLLLFLDIQEEDLL